MKPKHFICLNDLNAETIRALIAHAATLKDKRQANADYQPLKNKVLAMIFEKPSTRTRISFEAGMIQLGGQAIFLSSSDTQLDRGEPLKDSAKVISSIVDCILLRTHQHETVTTFAKYSQVPIINGLTNQAHPCQLLADMQTYFEHRGDIQGKTVAWLGDGNNMCNSYINASRILDFKLNIAAPATYLPSSKNIHLADTQIQIFSDPLLAAKNADLIVTDVWVSMGQEDEKKQRKHIFNNYQVNKACLLQAAPDALFMHCLPAHRGEEVSAEVIDGPQSVVFDEAENRLHIQKALLELLMC